MVVEGIEDLPELARAEQAAAAGQLQQAQLRDAEPVGERVGKFRIVAGQGFEQVQEQQRVEAVQGGVMLLNGRGRPLGSG
ncbi:MAG: hypothetical protein R3F46_16140 [bacterium]